MADGKWIHDLVPAMPVADAARVVLTTRFEVVRHYLPLAAQQPYEDMEYVHQLRVGTRRAGAALHVFGDCLPARHRRAMRRCLRTLRRAAGDARDWDVFILNLPEVRSLRTPTGKRALDYLLGYSLGQRAIAQAALLAAANEESAHLIEVMTELPKRTHEPHVELPPSSFGSLAAAQLIPEFVAFTAAVHTDPTDPAALHRLRIHGKHLRYAVEIFAGCFSPPMKDVLYPAIESLQELLGGLQDAAVGIERLTAIQSQAEKVIPNEWPKLRRGIAGTIRGWNARLTTGRKRFQAWRKYWLELVEAHPLPSLHLEPATVTIPDSPGRADRRPDVGRRRQRLNPST